MSLLHEDFSGFLPGYFTPYSEAIPGTVNIPLPINYISKLWWLSKSATISCDVAFNLELKDGSFSNTGTVKAASVAVGTGTMSQLPAVRVIDSSMIDTEAQSTSPIVVSGTRSDIGPYIDDSVSAGYTLRLDLFQGLGIVGLRESAAYFDESTGLYYMGIPLRYGMNANDDSDPQPSMFCGCFTAGGGRPPVSSSIISVRMNGTEIAPRSAFPVYSDSSNPYTIDPTDFNYSITGDFIIDFDNFWTP